jgi:urease accessory protein
VGAATIRITAADFVIPPDLQRWPLAAEGSGRIGGVRLGLESGQGGARLASCYQQVPLRVLPPFRYGPDRPALLYLLNPTAGLMDGDGQLVELQAGPGVRAVVVGQSSTRIHPTVSGLSTQQWRVSVATGAVLVVLPGPTIPFRGCRYYQRVEVDLAPGAGLLWGDVWFAGRYARGQASELFQFARLCQDFVIRREGHLVFRERFDWLGPWDEATADWHFGGSMACASLFVTGRVVDTDVYNAGEESALFSTAAGDTCFRWRGSSEVVTNVLVRTALQLAPSLVRNVNPLPWFSGHELAPCHWFSGVSNLHDGDTC